MSKWRLKDTGERKVEEQERDEAAKGRRKSLEQVVFWTLHFKAVLSNLSELATHAEPFIEFGSMGTASQACELCKDL